MAGSELFVLLARFDGDAATAADTATGQVAADVHADAGDHGGSGIDFNADLILVTLVLFLALLAVLSRMAWRPIMEGLDKREKSIADEIASAKRANEEAKANLRNYELKLAEVTDQTSSMLAEAKKDSLAIKDQIIAEANKAAQAQRERAVAEIKAAKDAAVRELAERSAETAVSLAGSIIGRSLNGEDHKSLIDESINGFVKRV